MKITAVFLLPALALFGQAPQIAWTDAEKPIYDQIHTLRSVPDDKRPAVTKDLALRIRNLPLTPEKSILAIQLSDLVTEGDPGHDTLQETAATLAGVSDRDSPDPAVRAEQPAKAKDVRRKALCRIKTGRAFTKWSAFLVA